MLPRLVRQSFRNQKTAWAVMVAAVSMGVAVSASLLSISLDIKGKVSRELRAFGANIVVEPALEGLADLTGQSRYLREEDVIKSKTIFWRHNILGVAPFLNGRVSINSGKVEKNVPALGAWFEKKMPLPGEAGEFTAGTVTVLPWWDIRGEYPSHGTVLLGVELAEETGLKAGSPLRVDGRDFTVSGTVSTGGAEDSMALFGLDTFQELKGLEGAVSKVLVSALTTPMDEFAYRDPDTMSRAEYEKWYCTGYVTSIAKQLGEVFKGSSARPVWRVAEAEGKVLGRMSVLIYLLSAAALLAAALGVSTTMVAGLLRRVQEIALMKSLGADGMKIGLIFFTEAFIIGIVGGTAGFLLSTVATKYIGISVFGTELTGRAVLFPVSLVSALVIAVLGSLLPIKRALGIKPALVLKGER